MPSDLARLEDRPEARNLVNIYAALADLTPQRMIADHGGQQFSTFKPRLADLAVAKLAPVSSEIKRLTAVTAEIDRVFAEGAASARALAGPILKRTYEIAGTVGA